MLTVGLVGGAVSVLLWPDTRTLRRHRAARVAQGSTRSPWPPAIAPTALPWLAALAALTAGAMLSTPLVAVLTGCCVALAARAWNRRRRTAGEDAALDALPDALAALAAELRSGRSLQDAIGTAAAGCADDSCGRSLVESIQRPTGSGSPGAGELVRALDRLASAVALSARTGCSLTAVVGAVEDDLRARHRHRLELRSATAGPRASAALLAGLPLLGLAMGSGIGADPWRVLTTTGTGQALLVAGVALEVGGMAWCSRLVRRALP